MVATGALAQWPGDVLTSKHPSGESGASTGLSAKMTDLVPRLISAVVIASVALTLFWVGGWWTAGLVMVASAALMWEWRRITCGADAASDAMAVLHIGIPVIGVMAAHVVEIERAVAFILIAGVLAAFLDRRAGRSFLWAFLGIAYIGVATACFVALRNEPAYGLHTILWITLVVVAADVGGYFAGRLIGGPKLWPRVSPKKTWAGTFGGIALAALVGLIFSSATTGTYFLQVCSVSMLAAAVSQMGDLAESSLKRHFGVKDSSGLIPGHGGALDRLDGFLAASLIAGAATFWRAEPMFIW